MDNTLDKEVFRIIADGNRASDAQISSSLEGEVISLDYGGRATLIAQVTNPYYIPIGLMAGHLYDLLCDYLGKNGYINFTGNFGKP